MTCTCPKCDAPIEVDVASLPPAGTFLPCPSCKSKFWAGSESFSRRALRKDGTIYCVNCGNRLSHFIICESCGVRGPEYWLIQVNKPAKREVQKSSFSFKFSLKPTKTSSSKTFSFKGSKSGKFGLKKSGTALIIAAVVLCLAAGIYYYLAAQQQYLDSFVKALYAVKSGADACAKQHGRVTGAWKAKTDAGQPFDPRLSPEEEARLNKVKNAVDGEMKKLTKTPKKYAAAATSLTKLHERYLKLHVVVAAPAANMAAFSDAYTKAENDFKATTQELKSNLTPELKESIGKVVSKYSNLQPMLQ